MKQLCKINQKKLSTFSGLKTSTNNNLIIRKDCYSNFLGFKTLNLTPNNEHFEDWNVAKKGIWEQNKWHYESDEEIMDDGNIINRNFVEEEQPLENDWDNNFRFKMGNKWIGFDEDSSSGQDRYTNNKNKNKRKNLEELFYSPNMEVHEFPEESDRLQYFTIEDIPQDISQEDVNSVLTKLIGEQCVSVERFEINRKSHLFVEMKSINSKNKLLTPARMNFGLFIKGKRCDIYDSIKRQKSVFLAKIPNSCNEEEIKEFIFKIMQHSNVEVSITKPHDHSYCFLEFKKHSTASNFIERINIMANQYANWGKGMIKPKSDVYSLFDQSLVGLKDKLSTSQNKLRKYQSLLELKGYRFDEDGDLIEDASEIEVEDVPKKVVSGRSKSISEDNQETPSRRKSNKAKVDISEEI